MPFVSVCASSGLDKSLSGFDAKSFDRSINGAGLHVLEAAENDIFKSKLCHPAHRFELERIIALLIEASTRTELI
ncbi:hypothetical protein [Sphingosinicella microcystinivorans]|uniref:Uncharacterized protein n=1 Tax=Sphingosinicella microcystinivorans TaxID=335406 RepID=A0AAD1DCQ8_SPHMI|nr:hypothetical protein [Sphingosinicella microcystinivorans]BBE36136.1 hypothetical protein SmB9_37940 [Sphingosinicella microcystinivorans]